MTLDLSSKVYQPYYLIFAKELKMSIQFENNVNTNELLVMSLLKIKK